MLAQLSFAIVHDASRRLRVGGLFFYFLFLCIYFLFFNGNRVHKFVSEKIATVCARHTFRRSRILMSTCPRHRARCDRHEARAGIVALRSCCLVRLSNGGLGPPGEIVSSPACTQRSICRDASPASRLDLLTLSGEKRGSCEALIFAVLFGTSIPDPEPVSCSCPRKTSSRARLLHFKEPRRAWSGLLVLCCDPTTVACLYSQNAAVQACLHTATLLSGSLISFRSFRCC